MWCCVCVRVRGVCVTVRREVETSLSMVLCVCNSEKGGRDEPLYGVVDCEHDDAEDDVYGRLVDRTTRTKVFILF